MPLLPLLRRIAQGGPPAGVSGPPPGVQGPPTGAFGPPPGVTQSVAKSPGASHGFHMSVEDARTTMGVLAMLLILCIIAVAGRLVSRRIVKQKLALDDLWVIAALILFIGQASVVFNNQNRGMQAAKSRKAPNMRILGKSKLAVSLLYVFTVTAARLSVLFLSRRIFNLRVKWFRIAWWTCLLLATLYWLYFCTSILSVCAPYSISASWNDPAKCTHQDISSPAAQGFLNVVIDLALWALPVRMVWALQLNKKQKYAISGVFALGFIAVIVSIVRAVTIMRSSNFATISGTVLFIIWSVVEPAVMILCTCLPTMRPLLNTIIKTFGGSSWLSHAHSRTRKNSNRRYSSKLEDEEKTLTATRSSPSPTSGIAASTITKQSFQKTARSDIMSKAFMDHREATIFYPRVETRIEALEMTPPPPPAPAHTKGRRFASWQDLPGTNKII